MAIKIPIEISARHVHLSQKDLEALFGPGYKLNRMKQLTQASDFAAEETVDIKSDSGVLKSVRIVGPVRQQTQAEISRTDAFSLGINPPINISGNLGKAANIVLVGPSGEAEAKAIIALRHLHCSVAEAKELNLKDKSNVAIKVEGERALIFRNVKVRVGKEYALCLHLDTDEGNAAGINKTGEGYLV